MKKLLLLTTLLLTLTLVACNGKDTREEILRNLIEGAKQTTIVLRTENADKTIRINYQEGIAKLMMSNDFNNGLLTNDEILSKETLEEYLPKANELIERAESITENYDYENKELATYYLAGLHIIMNEENIKDNDYDFITIINNEINEAENKEEVYLSLIDKEGKYDHELEALDFMLLIVNN